MAEETKKVESEVAPPPEPEKDIAEEKVVVPPPADEKPEDSKDLVVTEKAEDKPTEKGGPHERDSYLSRLETEKRMSLIKAWEESEKAKAENKAAKKLSTITSWENSKKASIELEFKKLEEDLLKKKAEYAEKMKNKIAQVHKEAEEKRALTESKKGQDIIKAEELAAKYRSTGLAPKTVFSSGGSCFGG